MVWTTPRTWVAGELVTAALMNTHLRDNLNALGQHTHSGADGDGGSMGYAFDQFGIGKRALRNLNIPWAPSGFTVTVIDMTSVSSAASGVTYSLANGSGFTIPSIAHTINHTGGSLDVYFENLSVYRFPLIGLPSIRYLIQTPTTSVGTVRFGFTNTNLQTDPSDAIYFRTIDPNSNNWFAVCRNGGSETAVNTTIAASTTIREFRIDVDAAANVKFYIDGTLRATITTNVPTNASLPCFCWAKSGTGNTVKTLVAATYMQISWLNQP